MLQRCKYYKPCVYKLTFPNGKIYIGQTIALASRLSAYRKLTCKTQRYLYFSLKIYGIDSCTLDILETPPLAELNNREIYWIEYYKSNASKYKGGIGLNMTVGGDKSNLGKPLNEKQRKALDWTGRKLTQEHKDNIGKGNKGKKLSPEQISALSKASKQYYIDNPDARKNRVFSVESRAKMSLSRIGNKNALGFKHTEETKQKHRRAKKSSQIMSQAITYNSLVIDYYTGIFYYGFEDIKTIFRKKCADGLRQVINKSNRYALI